MSFRHDTIDMNVDITVVLYVLVFLSGIELARTMAQTQSTMVLDGIC